MMERAWPNEAVAVSEIMLNSCLRSIVSRLFNWINSCGLLRVYHTKAAAMAGHQVPQLVLAINSPRVAQV